VASLFFMVMIYNVFFVFFLPLSFYSLLYSSFIPANDKERISHPKRSPHHSPHHEHPPRHPHGPLATVLKPLGHPQRRLDYAGFMVWLNCKEHAVFKFRYNAQRDDGALPRSSTFRLDPDIPYECQPSSPNRFKTSVLGALTGTREPSG
jgi:hypothetical protein